MDECKPICVILILSKVINVLLNKDNLTSWLIWFIGLSMPLCITALTACTLWALLGIAYAFPVYLCGSFGDLNIALGTSLPSTMPQNPYTCRVSFKISLRKSCTLDLVLSKAKPAQLVSTTCYFENNWFGHIISLLLYNTSTGSLDIACNVATFRKLKALSLCFRNEYWRSQAGVLCSK